MDVTQDPRPAVFSFLSVFSFLFSPLANADDAVVFQIIHLRASAPNSPAGVAIRSRGEWESFLKNSQVTLQSPETASPIDFDQYTLLVASSGVKPNGGYSIVFTSIRETRRADMPTLTVSLLDLGPGICPTTQELAHPIAFALIPKTDETIRFVISKADRDCNTASTIVTDGGAK
jgi:hypothetical protein